MELATKGVAGAVAADASLAGGVNTHGGSVTNPAVGEALGVTPTPLPDALNGG
jgi:alanine dehydrogenase